MEQETVGHKILIIQCDCGHLHSNLIACARHKVIDEIVVPQSSSNKEVSEDRQSSIKKQSKDTQLLCKGNASEDTQSSSEEKQTQSLSEEKQTQSLSQEKQTQLLSEEKQTQSLSEEETFEDTQSSDKETKSQSNSKPKTELSSTKNKKVEKKSTIHVVFIVQLPRKAGGTNFVGFQGGNWLSVHLDDLRSPKENELSFQSAIQCSISDIFNSMYQSFTSTTLEQETEPTSLNQKLEPSSLGEELEPCEHSQYQSLSENVSQALNVTTDRLQSGSFNANRRLRDLIQMACSCLYDTEQNRERTTERINILTDLIPTESTRGWQNFAKYVT